MKTQGRRCCFRPEPGTSTAGRSQERAGRGGPCGPRGSPRELGLVRKSCLTGAPAGPARSPSFPPSAPLPGLPSSLRCAVPEAALATASPCPNRAGSPPRPRDHGALPPPAKPRSMPMKKPVDRLPSQEKRKDLMRKKQQALGAVSPPEPVLVEQPRLPRCQLPLLQPASLPV